MHLNFIPFNVDREQALRGAGYTSRMKIGDWVKQEGAGLRFHAKKAGENGIELHADIYTGDGDHHFSFPANLALKAEVRRIISTIPKTQEWKGRAKRKMRLYE